jgi:hypothetical protein
LNVFTRFEELVDAVKQLGVNVVAVSNKELQKLISGGIEVQNDDEVIRRPHGIYRVLKDGRVVKVVLYISQKRLTSAEIPAFADLHKYHLFNCRTLEHMQRIGRGERYRISSRNDGRFDYTLIRNNREFRTYNGDSGASLSLCGNCQRLYDEAYNRDGKNPFDLPEFLKGERFSGMDPRQYRYDMDDVLNIYREDWPEIANRIKRSREWRCEECGIVLSGNLKRFLHAHHLDGQLHNNVVANIKVLCIRCHADQPLHGHIRTHRDYSEFMNSDAFHSANRSRRG